MAKAGRKSTTARKRKRKHRKSEHKAAAPKAEPERALFVEKLGGHPPPPFVIRPLKPITVSAEQWAEMRRRAAEWQRGRRSIDRAAAIRDGLIRPPWMEKRRRQEEGSRVRLAKELIAVAYPGGEWRTMRIVDVRHGCAPAAEARGMRLPSWDSFSRAMGRRE